MHPIPLSLTARTLFAELRELALAIGASERPGDVPGTIVEKQIRGTRYLYLQHRDLAGTTRQAYLGPDNDATRALIARLEQRRGETAEDVARLSELRAAFLAVGGAAMPHGPFRVVRAFFDSGLLRPGPAAAVLVGTHAFVALGNLLGVRWAGGLMTHDIDIAADRDVDFALPHATMAVPDVLESLGMGFLPVPTLNARASSTSYRVRGQELRVDLLTPLVGKPSRRSVLVPALRAAAQPLRFLDYLLEDSIAVPICSSSGIALVNVPQPARFAFHKLIVSEERGSAFATKAEKDREQAAQLIEVMGTEAPAELAAARRAMEARGRGWVSRLRRAIAKASRTRPTLATLARS